jgi:hypothetical protein
MEISPSEINVLEKNTGNTPAENLSIKNKDIQKECLKKCGEDRNYPNNI